MWAENGFKIRCFGKKWRKIGYEVILYYLSLPDEEMAVERVQLRVTQGGHNVPVDVIKRGYHRGWENFLDHYKALVDTWVIFDNSGISPVIIEKKP